MEDILFEGKQVKPQVEEKQQRSTTVESEKKAEKVAKKANPSLEQRKSQVGKTSFPGYDYISLLEATSSGKTANESPVKNQKAEEPVAVDKHDTQSQKSLKSSLKSSSRRSSSSRSNVTFQKKKKPKSRACAVS